MALYETARRSAGMVNLATRRRAQPTEAVAVRQDPDAEDTARRAAPSTSPHLHRVSAAATIPATSR